MEYQPSPSFSRLAFGSRHREECTGKHLPPDRQITGTALFGKRALIFLMGWLEVLSRFKWLPCTRITGC